MGANRTNDKRPFEVERERPTGKEVIMSIDYHCTRRKKEKRKML